MKDIINDCYIDVFGKSPIDIQISEIANNLPSDIKILAEQWGWYDTEVREKIYQWLKQRGELFA